MPSGTPTTARLSADVDPQATKGTTQNRVIGEAPVTGVVTEVTVIPVANVTANGTNYRTLTVQNRGASGSGTTAVAALALDTPTTDDLTAFDEKEIPLSGTASNLAVTEGDVLAVVETVTGEGVAHGGYTVNVKIARS